MLWATAAGEQERLLGDQRDLAPHAAEVELGQVDAVVAHAPALRNVEPDRELDQRALARAGVADERHRLPGLDPDVDVADDPALVLVGEPDVLEGELAAQGGRRLRRPGSWPGSGGSARISSSFSSAAAACWKSPTSAVSCGSGASAWRRYAVKETISPTSTAPPTASRAPYTRTAAIATAIMSSTSGSERAPERVRAHQPHLGLRVVALEVGQVALLLPEGAHDGASGKALRHVRGHLRERVAGLPPRGAATR